MGKRLFKGDRICLKYEINLILELIVKDRTKRMTLTEVLEHPWITENCSDLREMRKNSDSISQFKLYSHQQPHSPKILDEVIKRTTDEFGGY